MTLDIRTLKPTVWADNTRVTYESWALENPLNSTTAPVCAVQWPYAAGAFEDDKVRPTGKDNRTGRWTNEVCHCPHCVAGVICVKPGAGTSFL
ncbi:hypothetical protein AAVH_24752 [Aphelenchoides avenae]|nr:hypothetical protein AAVH_24752 [Aphelenchus avenae]